MRASNEAKVYAKKKGPRDDPTEKEKENKKKSRDLSPSPCLFVHSHDRLKADQKGTEVSLLKKKGEKQSPPQRHVESGPKGRRKKKKKQARSDADRRRGYGGQGKGSSQKVEQEITR